jgi:DNA-binding transcriptional ArsR family regulator
MSHDSTHTRRWDRRSLAEPELPLFAAPPANATDSSQAAAAMIAEHAPALRERILLFIRERGEQGATNEEIADALGLRPNSETGRATELKDAGLIRDSGRRRRARSGVRVIIWVPT